MQRDLEGMINDEDVDDKLHDLFRSLIQAGDDEAIDHELSGCFATCRPGRCGRFQGKSKKSKSKKWKICSELLRRIFGCEKSKKQN